jgi:DNA helicase IV
MQELVGLIKQYTSAKDQVDYHQRILEELEKDINILLKGDFPKRIVVGDQLFVLAKDRGKLKIHTTQLNGVFQ